MRAVVVTEFGGPEVLVPGEVPEPGPDPGTVRIAVEVAGVPYGDTIVRSGRFPVPLPLVPGLEVGGHVLATAEGVDGVCPGQRVVATTVGNRGGYAEVAVAEPGNVFAVPDEVDLVTAVAGFQAGSVALGVTEVTAVGPGTKVLVLAAAGRIGALIVQVARARGAQVVGAVGSRAKADVAIGAASIATLADGRGRIGLHGYASGTWTEIDPQTLGRRGLTALGSLGQAIRRPAAEQRGWTERTLASIADGSLTVTPGPSFPLEDAAAAHALLESRASAGAVTLRVR